MNMTKIHTALRILFLLLMMVGAGGAWADTEIETDGRGGAAADITIADGTDDTFKDKDFEGTSYVIPGTYIAGVAQQFGSMTSKGLKLRLNRNSNTLLINVKSGYVIQSVVFQTYGNSGKTYNIDKVDVDGVSKSWTTVNVTATSSPSSSQEVSIADMKAVQSIKLYFSGEATQAGASYKVTYFAKRFAFSSTSGNLDLGSSLNMASLISKNYDGTITYSSSNTSVATINASTGLLTARGAGTSTITATITDASGATATTTYALTVVQSGNMNLTSSQSAYVDQTPGQADKPHDGSSLEYLQTYSAQRREYNTTAAPVKVNDGGRIAFYKFDISTLKAISDIGIVTAIFKVDLTGSGDGKYIADIAMNGYNGQWDASSFTYNMMENNSGDAPGTVEGSASFQPLNDTDTPSSGTDFPQAFSKSIVKYLQSAIDAGKDYVTIAVFHNSMREAHWATRASLEVTYNVRTTYTIRYHDTGGNALKVDRVVDCFVGDEITATSADMATFYDGNLKYSYTSGNTTKNTVKDVDQNVITLVFNTDARSTYTYTVQAKNDGNVIATLATGTVEEGVRLNMTYPKHVLKDNTLYTIAAGSNNPGWYVLNSDIPNNDYYIDLNYNETPTTDVVCYMEAEDIPGVRVASQSNRFSKGSAGYTNGSYISTGIQLPSGRYKFYWSAGAGGSNQNAGLKVGDNEFATFSFDGGSWDYRGNEEVTITKGGILEFKSTGRSNGGVDWFYLQGILAFSEASGEFKLSDTGKKLPTLVNSTGETATITSNDVNVVTVDASGNLTFKKIGRTTIKATAGGYMTEYTVTVKADTDATGVFDYDSNTFTETFTLSGTGNLGEHHEGQRITMDVGNADEMQLVSGDGLYCLDNNGGWTHVFLGTDGTSGVPTMGSYYAFTPKFSGYLTIKAKVSAQNGIRLVDKEGTQVGKKIASSEVSTSEKEYTFTTKLSANQTYYVYAETNVMTDRDTDAFPTLYLKSFTFNSLQEEEMTIEVSDLLIAPVEEGKTALTAANQQLDRVIPGFTLTFTGNDGVSAYNYDRLTFHQNESGTGQLVITPRLKGSEGDLQFNRVVLNYSTLTNAAPVKINDGDYTLEAGSSTKEVDLSGTMPTTLKIRYGSDTDDNSFVLTSITLGYQVTTSGTVADVIDLGRTSTRLYFDDTVFYVAKGYPETNVPLFTQAATAYTYGTGFRGHLANLITFTSADETVATVNENTGEVQMQQTEMGSETTITAKFVGTDYFLPSDAATYTVKSAKELDAANPYVISPVQRGMVVEVEASTKDGEEAVLNFTNTIATTHSVADDNGQQLLTYAFDNGGSNEAFEVTITHQSGAPTFIHSARAYYRKPDLRLNYTPQAVYNHRENWNDSWTREGFVSGADQQAHFANNQSAEECFDLEGEPTFTALFEGKDLKGDFTLVNPRDYTLTGNIEIVSGTTADIRSTDNGSNITDATVSCPVEMSSLALGYDPTDDNNVATALLKVIPFPYTWDFTTGGEVTTITEALETHNLSAVTQGTALADDASHTYLASGVLLSPGSRQVQSGNAYNYVTDPTKDPSWIRIPVMQGMKVSVTCVTASYGTEREARQAYTGWKRRYVGNGYPLQVSNVTDTRGYAIATLEIYDNVTTQHFIAKDDGYVEIYNRSDINVIISSISVTAPELEFEDGIEPYVSWSVPYKNAVVNKPAEATLTFADSDHSDAVQMESLSSDGTVTFKSLASGQFKVTATTGTTAKNLEPCWGQYTLHIYNFYILPTTHTLQIRGTQTFNALTLFEYCTPYLEGKKWAEMSEADRQRVTFSVSVPSSYPKGSETITTNNAKAVLLERSDVDNPFTLEVRNDGAVKLTAVYRREGTTVSTVKAECLFYIENTGYNGFKYAAPSVSAETESYTFGDSGTDNPMSNVTMVNSYRVYYIGKADGGKKEEVTSPVFTQVSTKGTLDLTKMGSERGCGAYLVEAYNSSDALLDKFYLTKAYPVDKNTSQSWIFGGVESDGETYHLNLHDEEGNGINMSNTSRWARGMPTNRGSDYRYLNAVNGDNGFIVRETAGLQIIAAAPTCAITVGSSGDENRSDGHFSIYHGSRGDYVYPNIGLHRSTLIIPHLPKGAYVAVAWERTNESSGNRIVCENLLDLEGKTIDVIRYGGSVRQTGTNAGRDAGFYTMRVAEDGDVSFTQDDQGTSRIVAIHVYYGDPDTSVPASDDKLYNANDKMDRFRGSGMTQKLMAYAKANEDGTADTGSGTMELNGILTIGGKQTSQWLTNFLNFQAPNGVPEFKMVNQDETLHGMTLDLSQTYFDSGNGTYAVPGLSFDGDCWGKAVLSVGVRDMNDYLVAYRQYHFTVGVRPTMDYPKTWDFTRYFDNATARIEDSPVEVLPSTVGLNTKNSLAENTGYTDHTIKEDPAIKDTDPTRTWDSGNTLMRNSGEEMYLQYGYNQYSSYYVDDAMLVCNLGERNADGFILEETRGLGFNIAPDEDTDTSKKLQWQMPDGTVGYGDNCHMTLNGTMTIAAIGSQYRGYYVFLRSSTPPTTVEGLSLVTSGDYNRIGDYNEGQFVYQVTTSGDMTMTFNSDTEIYGIGVTNIRKDALHPVGGTGWATESRDVDIDHTLTGYYTKHPLRTYAVTYDSYDLNTATVKLTEVKNAAPSDYDDNTQTVDHGYVPKGTGVVLAEMNVSETAPYRVPLFVPAVTTTHEALVPGDNMMHPNLVAKQYDSEVEGDGTRFLLTNIHWTFTKGGELASEEANSGEEADAAGFYRHHVWTTDDAAKNTMPANTAYLLVPTGQLPVAVWNSTASSSRMRNSIAIRFDDITDIKDTRLDADVQNRTGWYTLNGVKLNGQPTKAGLYICNGRKVVVK